MTPPPDNFDQLQRLLRLKRHEQPPPRYFNEFSSHVIAHLRANVHDRKGLALEDRLTWESPLLARLLSLFEARPTTTGIFGATVCALLIFGVVYSKDASSMPMAEQPAVPVGPIAPTLAEAALPLMETDRSALVSSTNPMIQPDGSLFNQVRVQAMPVSFQPAGR